MAGRSSRRAPLDYPTMHRPGSNTADMQMADFLCDFCRRPWDGTFAMVEGHQGSLICQTCLMIAYTEVVMGRAESPPEGRETCVMCLEKRDDPGWSSPAHDDALICRRCIKQGAGRLHKDPDVDWRKPDATVPSSEDADD
jgi:hypothetical protein